MRIEFERTGGFAGMRVAATIDSQTLPEDKAQALKEMIEQAGFFDLPPRLVSPTPGMDQFQYRLTIESAERGIHTIETSDAAAPPQLQPLLRELTLLARGQSR